MATEWHVSGTTVAVTRAGRLGCVVASELTESEWERWVAGGTVVSESGEEITAEALLLRGEVVWMTALELRRRAEELLSNRFVGLVPGLKEEGEWLAAESVRMARGALALV